MRNLLLASLLLASLITHAEPTLWFARNENLPEQDVAEAVFLQAMRNLKVPVVVDAVPPARANMLVLSGAVAQWPVRWRALIAMVRRIQR
jgi:hypothetical protein